MNVPDHIADLLAEIEAGPVVARADAVELGWAEPSELRIGDRFLRWDNVFQVVATPARMGDAVQALAAGSRDVAWNVAVRRCHPRGAGMAPEVRDINLYAGRPVELVAAAIDG